MPPLSTRTTVNTSRFVIGEVDDYGDHDLGKRANSNLRTGIARVRTSQRMNMLASIDVMIDTNEFEEPPIFTIELNERGPKLYLHGISGELAVEVTVLEDGSIEIKRH